MGPLEINQIFDVIWVEADKMHFVVGRNMHVPIEKYMLDLKDIARGLPSTMAGYNATGYDEMKDILTRFAEKKHDWYYEVFLPNLKKNTNVPNEHKRIIKNLSEVKDGEKIFFAHIGSSSIHSACYVDVHKYKTDEQIGITNFTVSNGSENINFSIDDNYINNSNYFLLEDGDDKYFIITEESNWQMYLSVEIEMVVINKKKKLLEDKDRIIEIIENSWREKL